MWGAIFPGQGSQSVGMGKLFFENFKSAQLLFEEASDALKIDMEKLCFDGPESELVLTENTQPALLLVSTAINNVLRDSTGFRPQYGAGHSLGEYSALVSAGVIGFTDALRAVRARGLAMQFACPVGEGGMAAVLGLEDADVEELCRWVETASGHHPLRAANFNSPGQVVISGLMKAIEWLRQNAATSGKKFKLIPLNVSAPFHSPLMKPAQDKMESVLKDIHFSPPRFAIVQNTTAQECTDVNAIRAQLTLQISAPVKWAQSVIRLKELGVKNLVEVGAGKVLSGLVKKIDSEHFKTFNLQTLEDFKNLESQF